MAELSFVVFSELEETIDELEEGLTQTGHVRVAATVREPAELLEAVRTNRADALFAYLGEDPEAILDLLEEIPAPRPALLVVGRHEDTQLILRAMRLGAREFFPDWPSWDVIREAIERLVLEYQPSAPVVETRAPAIAVMGAKGGVGGTTLACQLAAELQSRGGRTVVVDLNLPLGDVAFSFDVEPTYTLAHMASEIEQLDATYLRSIIQGHASGVQILAAPTRVEESELIQGQHVELALGILRREYDWIVLDVSRNWDEPSMRALDLADQILLVTTLEVAALNHARQHLDVLKRLGHLDSSIRLILNQHGGSQAVTERDFAKCLGRGPDARIPSDFQTASSSVHQGKPIGEIAPRSRIHLALGRLADQVYTWCEVEREEQAGGGLIGRLPDGIQRLLRKR